MQIGGFEVGQSSSRQHLFPGRSSRNSDRNIVLYTQRFVYRHVSLHMINKSHMLKAVGFQKM